MLIDLLEMASNQALAHDSATLERLRKLQGKTMALQIKPFSQLFHVTPQLEGLEFTASDAQQPDVRLNVTIPAMIKISRDGIDDAELQTGELEIIGDPILGQRFAQVIAQLDIDWEALLAQQFGASPARAAVGVAAELKQLGDESQTRFKALIKRLLNEDFALIAGKPEVDIFLDEVDTLRADADRLSIRLKRLQSQM